MRIILLVILMMWAGSEYSHARAPIGEAIDVKGSVTVVRNQKPLDVNEGFRFFKFDTVQTSISSSVVLALADGSVMSLGQRAEIIMDEIVYDDLRQDGIIDLNLLVGSFRFISGVIAKSGPDLIKLKTPVATIGIRGTSLAGRIFKLRSEIVLLRDLDDRVGALSITNDKGSILIEQEFQGISVQTNNDNLKSVDFTKSRVKTMTEDVPVINYRTFWKKAYDSLFMFQFR